MINMNTCFNQQNNLGIMDNQIQDDDDGDDLHSISSSSSSSSIVSNESSNSSDFMEDATSLSSSSSSDHHIINSIITTCDNGPLYEMDSLMQQLPIKRGLSKHFQGKSQSFTSLSNVKCLEDLAKPDQNSNPYKKKLKSCKSYGGGLSDQTNKVSNHPKTSSKIISKKASRGSWSSLSIGKRSNSFINKPPVHPPQRSSTTLFNQTPLFT